MFVNKNGNHLGYPLVKMFDNSYTSPTGGISFLQGKARTDEEIEIQASLVTEVSSEIQLETKSIISKLLDYVKKEKFEAIIFLDNAARPASRAFREAWRKDFPKEECPKNLFLNPYGFYTKELEEELSKSDPDLLLRVKDKFAEKCKTGKVLEATNAEVLSRERVSKELDSLLKKSGLEKSSKILIFDTCLHSGATISPLLQELKAYGLNTTVALGSDSDHTGIKAQNKHLKNIADIAFQKKEAIGGCMPFGKQEVTKQNMDSIHSKVFSYRGDEAKVALLAYKEHQAAIAKAMV